MSSQKPKLLWVLVKCSLKTDRWVQQVEVDSDSGKCHLDGKFGMSESPDPESLREEGRPESNTNGHKEEGQK